MSVGNETRPLRRVEVAALLALASLALVVRVWPAWHNVFTPDGVALAGTDPWFHLRRAHTLVAHFPHAGAFDPYLGPPGGRRVDTPPLLDVVIAAIALVVGGGRPREETVTIAAAWLPAALGALCVVPVFLLARRLWGTTAGVVAGALVAVLPGGLLQRSVLGQADHHVAEALLAATVLALLGHALAFAPEDSPVDGRTTSLPSPRLLRSAGRPVLLAAAAGVALAAFQLTWRHAWAFALLLGAWLVLQWGTDMLGGRRADGSAGVGLVAFAVACATVFPLAHPVTVGRDGPVVFAALAGLAGALLGATWLGGRLGIGRRTAVAAFAAAAVVAGVALARTPSAASTLGIALRRLVPGPEAATVAEVEPLLTDTTWARLFGELALAPLFALPGLLILAARVRRHRHPAEMLVLVACGAFAAAALAQRRFSYYLALALALLSGLAFSHLASRLGTAGPARPWGRAGLALAAAVLLGPALLLCPIAAAMPSGPSAEWRATLRWLRVGTPEPYGSASAYDAPCPDRDEGLLYPRSAVLAWWDAGYWLTSGARRVPVTNPTQFNAKRAARFFLAQTDGEALGLARDLGARWVIADPALPILRRPGLPHPQGTLPALAIWAGLPVERLTEIVEVPRGDRLEPVGLFYPEYFRSFAVRTAVFDGQGVRAGPAGVVSFEPGERRPRRARSLLLFGDPAAAAAELARRPPGTARLASLDPLRPCVDLEPLGSFRRVFRSPPEGGTRVGSAVQVFERAP